MLYPTIQDLTHGKFNRYELVIATAKCARLITSEYVRQREEAEKMLSGTKDSEKAVANMIDREYRDVKAVKVAINHILSGDYSLCREGDYPEDAPVEAAAPTFTLADNAESEAGKADSADTADNA